MLLKNISLASKVYGSKLKYNKDEQKLL